jgi:hypothetical protein
MSAADNRAGCFRAQTGWHSIKHNPTCMKVYFEQIYDEIGLLFYAVAAEHRKLHGIDVLDLKHLIEANWKPLPDQDKSLQHHLAGYLYSGLRNAFENCENPQAALTHFKCYYQVHSLAFGESLKANVIATVNTIASEFCPNGHKSAMIQQLSALLKIRPVSL